MAIPDPLDWYEEATSTPSPAGVAARTVGTRPTLPATGCAASATRRRLPKPARMRLSLSWTATLWSRASGRSRGQAIVELAIILPVLLLLLLAAADLARLFNSRVTISSAARAGALEAAQGPTSFQAGQPCSALTNRIMCAVLTETAGSSVTITAADVGVTCVPSPCSESLGSEVRVSVVGHFSLITPVLAMFTGGQAFDVTSTASAQIAVRPVIAAAATSTPAPVPTQTPAPTPTPAPTGTPNPLATPTPAPTATPVITPSPTPMCFAPIADFSRSPTSGKKKLTEFFFTDLSTTTADCPLTWSWNFGDGGGASSTSTLQNPTHIYEVKGVYTVTLVVSNAGGSASRARSVTVTP